MADDAVLIKEFLPLAGRLRPQGGGQGSARRDGEWRNDTKQTAEVHQRRYCNGPAMPPLPLRAGCWGSGTFASLRVLPTLEQLELEQPAVLRNQFHLNQVACFQVFQSQLPAKHFLLRLQLGLFIDLAHVRRLAREIL